MLSFTSPFKIVRSLVLAGVGSYRCSLIISIASSVGSKGGQGPTGPPDHRIAPLRLSSATNLRYSLTVLLLICTVHGIVHGQIKLMVTLRAYIIVAPLLTRVLASQSGLGSMWNTDQDPLRVTAPG